MLHSWQRGLGLSALIYFGLLGGLSAGPLASAQEKLDHLIGSWKGNSLDRLHAVWGREQSVDLQRGNRVFVFERHVKVRAAGFGVAVFGGNGLQCVGRFEVDDKNQIVRSWWQGGGVQECWGALRKYEP
jgi:hypothetical protein